MSRFADDTVVDVLIARAQQLDHANGSVRRIAFLVGGEQKGNRTCVRRVVRDQNRSTATTEAASQDFMSAAPRPCSCPWSQTGVKGSLFHCGAWPRGDDIDMAGETQHWRRLTTPGPEVLDLAEARVPPHRGNPAPAGAGP